MELPIKKPEGEFVLVPTEPTDGMLKAYDQAREATTLYTRVDGRPVVTYNPHQSYWALLNARPRTDGDIPTPPVMAAAQVLAENAPYYFADASAKMETRPNPSAIHIAKMMLKAADRNADADGQSGDK